MATKNIEFTERLEQAITESGFDKKTFSKNAGLNYSTLMTYLAPGSRGRVPEWDQLVKIAKASGKSVDWLLTGNETKGKPMTQWPEEIKNACLQTKEILLSNHPVIKPMLLSNLFVYQHCVKSDKPRRKNDKLKNEEIQKLRGRIKFLEEWHKAERSTGTDGVASSNTGK